MKQLFTHLYPHLDDICAFWLLKRYLPEAREAAIGFVTQAERAAGLHDDENAVYIGVGKGKYDEHKGDIGDCATSLVWKDIRDRAVHDGQPASDQERRAVQKIVDWALLEDTGKLGSAPRRAFSVPAILEAYSVSHGRDSLATTEFGFQLLDALVVAQRAEVRTEDVWAKRVEFDSPYGKAVALVGDERGLSSYAYAQGFALAVISGTDGKYHTVRADGAASVDLTPVKDALAKADPEAEWFFHHSKKMLICGGEHMPNSPTSRLTQAELIALLRA